MPGLTPAPFNRIRRSQFGSRWMNHLILLLVLTMTVVLPGLGLQALLLPADRRTMLDRLGLAAILPISLTGIVATLFGPLGFPPLFAVGVVTFLGLALLPSALRGFTPVDPGTRATLAIAALFAIAILVTFPQPSLTSDLWAHSAAVRACIVEDAVFPQHEFYPPGSGTGPDPRFGAGHAIFAVWARLAGVEPHWLWPWVTAWSLFTLTLVAFRMGLATTRHRLAAALAALGLVASLGGDVYNLLRVAGFPLWLALGHVSLPVAMAFDGERPPRRLTVLTGVVLAGAGALHAFAFIVGALLLTVAAVTAPARTRGGWLRFAVGAVLLAIPVVAVRFLVSYGNVNPIHQWPWRAVQVGTEAYIADPLFLARWWKPWGWVGLALGILYMRRCLRDHASRWSLALAALVLAWLLVPPILTPSIRWLGFLPIRLPVAVIFAPLFGQAAEVWLTTPRRAWGRGAFVVAALSMLWTLRDKADMFGTSSSPEEEYLSPRILEDLESYGPDTVILSDPFTMMMLKAQSDVSIVAVPDGRSSPRDANAIVRLRDSWRALSPATDLQDAIEVLDAYDVDFVLLNHGFEADRVSYEYPVDTATFESQRAKFDERGLGLELLNRSGKQWLFTTRDRSPASHYVPIATVRRDVVPDVARQRLHESFFVTEAQAELDSATNELTVRGWLGWDGAEPAPDRRLVVRVDHETAPVPPALEDMAKPWRKVRERVEKRRYRVRWSILPSGGAVPTYHAAPGLVLKIEEHLKVPAYMAPGRYRVTIQTVHPPEFEPLRLRDFVRDDDFYQGPTIGTVEID